jgi:hypothetical protein
MGYEAKLEQAMEESMVVRALVQDALDLQTSLPPVLTNAEEPPEVSVKWARVDEAMMELGYI